MRLSTSQSGSFRAVGIQRAALASLIHIHIPPPPFTHPHTWSRYIQLHMRLRPVGHHPHSHTRPHSPHLVPAHSAPFSAPSGLPSSMLDRLPGHHNQCGLWDLVGGPLRRLMGRHCACWRGSCGRDRTRAAACSTARGQGLGGSTGAAV